MDAGNKIVNSLWIGNELSKLELLTIKSFLAHGHPFHLWTYAPLKASLPEGLAIMDASLIIPSEQVFEYKFKNKYGHGKGSVAGFSDIFRYKLLFEKGGWWVDMDVTCLKPLDFSEEYFFRNHHELNVVGNVMKCPPGSKLMGQCFKEAITNIDASNTDWHKPIQILNDHIAKSNLRHFIKRGLSNNDQWHQTRRFIKFNQAIPENWYFIHWQNEEWRRRNLSKEEFYYKSALARLLAKYGLFNPPTSIRGKLINSLKNGYI